MSESILKELARHLKAITPAQVERCRSILTPMEPGDVLIAEITDPEAQRLWSLSIEYERQGRLLVHAARFDTTSGEERQQLKEQASRFQALEEIARNMAWLRFRDMAVSTYSGGTIGLRENFTLVKAADQGETPIGDGIAIPIPPQLLTGLAGFFRRMREEPEEDAEPKDPKKSKPQ
jgi:hypothetical protein